MYSWNVGNDSSLVVAWSSDKHDGNILTVPQDLPAYVVMMIVASGPVDFLKFGTYWTFAITIAAVVLLQIAYLSVP